ncbi:hypothetical protein BBC05_00485 [Serratia sp. ISTD04]|nr:hypothetical protein BBC05_00485 [Serratia sp. ISTD04]
MKQTPGFLRWHYLYCSLQTNHRNRLMVVLQKYLRNRYLPHRQTLHLNRFYHQNQILRPSPLVQIQMLLLERKHHH